MNVHRARVTPWLLVCVALTLLFAGCAKKKTPAEITDVNRALGQAKDACASVYAPSDLAATQRKVDAMNGLVDDKKIARARKQALPLKAEVDALKAKAQSARDAAKQEADAAIDKARDDVQKARAAKADNLAPTQFSQARDKLEQARSTAKDPCAYRDAASLARDASSAAERARTAAVAEQQRRDAEEARRRAEEEARRRAEEEARRRAEEEARRRPKTYVVQRGDYLWKISGMERIYTDPTLWSLIFDANRGKIGNPDLIYPGQEFTIPRDMTPEQMRARVRELWRELP